MPFSPACCDLNSDPSHPYRGDPPRRYTDAFGFVYRLCDVHYQALAAGLHKARGARPSNYVLARPWRRHQRRRRILASSTHADGAGAPDGEGRHEGGA